MNTRRVPLASLQNATNSPLRAPIAGEKRQRSHASEQRDLPYGQTRPAKRQIIEVDDAEARRAGGLVRRSGAPISAFQKKLEAVREVKVAPKTTERSHAAQHNLETIRQWQKHYRKMFPSFVFYFESVPEDVRVKMWRQAQLLGAVSIILPLVYVQF